MYTVADYAIRHGVRPHAPAAIFCAGGTLYPHMADAIEEAFRSPAIDFYGSREMGDVACACLERRGLHIAPFSHKVEVVDRQDRAVFEEDGDLLITCLTNLTMPFIRYRIGDRGRLTARGCTCGRGSPLLESISGRTMEVFITSKGEYVDPIYFTPGGNYREGVFGSDYLSQYQLVQEDYLRIRVKMVLRPGVTSDELEPKLNDLSETIRVVMGDECEVVNEFVDEIPPTRTGKHLLTIREIPDDRRFRGAEQA
jgi:phenylacetate-CoA ligase